MNKIIRHALAATALATMLSSVSATAATLVVDVAGVNSFSDLESGNNSVYSYHIGSGSRITGIAYNVTLTAYEPSWLSEMALSFGPSDISAGVTFTPGYQNDEPGTGTYAESVSLEDIGFDFAVGADGLLRLEYFERFDDINGTDGVWNSGTITFTYTPTETGAVPEPAAWAMMLAGFGLIGAGMRRRTSVKAAVTYA
jgi:hypothetical protein